MTQEKEISVETRHKNTSEQKIGIGKTVVGLAFIMAIFLGLTVNKILSPRVLSSQELSANRAIVFNNPRVIKSFSLFDHNGEDFSVKNLENKWSLIYFGFTHCPDICPTTLNKLKQVVDALDKNIQKQTQVVMVSVDPARDNSEKLAQYVTFFHPEFIGVSGDFLQTLALTQSVNVAFNKVVQEEGYTIDHSGNLVLINPLGHYHGFFKPPFELARLKLTFQSIVTSSKL